MPKSKTPPLKPASKKPRKAAPEPPLNYVFRLEYKMRTDPDAGWVERPDGFLLIAADHPQTNERQLAADCAVRALSPDEHGVRVTFLGLQGAGNPDPKINPIRESDTFTLTFERGQSAKEVNVTALLKDALRILNLTPRFTTDLPSGLKDSYQLASAIEARLAAH